MPPPSSLPVQSKPGLAALPRRGNNALWGIVNSAASGSQPRSTTSLQPNGFPISSNSNIRGPADKHALSLRLLLTQAEETVEGFSDKITRVIKDVSEARTEVQETGRLFEEGQSQILSETRLLVARTQSVLQKAWEESSVLIRALGAKLDEAVITSNAKQDLMQQQITTLSQQLQSLTDKQLDPVLVASLGAFLDTQSSQRFFDPHPTPPSSAQQNSPASSTHIFASNVVPSPAFTFEPQALLQPKSLAFDHSHSLSATNFHPLRTSPLLSGSDRQLSEDNAPRVHKTGPENRSLVKDLVLPSSQMHARGELGFASYSSSDPAASQSVSIPSSPVIPLTAAPRPSSQLKHRDISATSTFDKLVDPTDVQCLSNAPAPARVPLASVSQPFSRPSYSHENRIEAVDVPSSQAGRRVLPSTNRQASLSLSQSLALSRSDSSKRISADKRKRPTNDNDGPLSASKRAKDHKHPRPSNNKRRLLTFDSEDSNDPIGRGRNGEKDIFDDIL